MRRRRYLFNSTSTTIDGIEEVLYDGIVLSYQNNNQEILLETISTLDDIIYTSIATTTSLVFYRNLPLVKSLYKLSLSNGKYSSEMRRKSYESIRSKITSVLYRIEEKTDETNNEILVKEFLRYSLTVYNDLLHDILINKDLETYKDASNQFYTYIFKKHANHESNKPKDALTHDIEYYVNTVAILQYSWIIYLYKKQKITQKECIQYLNENWFTTRNYERIIDTLLYIDAMSHLDAFGVDEWENDIIGKVNHSMARSPLQPKTWTNLGMMIYLLKNSGLVTKEINTNRIRSTINYFELYFDDFQATLSEIRANKEIWIPVIFNNTLSDITTNSNHEDEFLKRIDSVCESLKKAAAQLMKIEFINNNNILSTATFLETKALEYKDAVGSQWYNRSFLHRLFDNYGNWKNAENVNEIIPVGQFIFQQGMKTMFVEKGNLVYGSADFGGVIADYEDGAFLKSIKNNDIPVREFNSIIECLDTLIETIKINKFTPTVIIVGTHWHYADTDLNLNSDYIPDWKVNESEEYSSNFSLYKDIPLYTSYNDDFEQYIVVADFENAFILNQIRNDSWYKEQLQVDTIPVDDTEARRIFNEDSEGWKISPKGFELSEEEAINYIKTGIVWDIHVRETFEIKNKLAYAIGKIQIKKNEDTFNVKPL